MLIIELKNVFKSFLLRNGKTLDVLRNINFSAKKHKFVSIIGPSGCGKTTLLKSIASLVDIDSGEISIQESVLGNALKHNAIGMVFQEPALLPWRTVSKNVKLPGEIFADKKIIDNSERMIELVGLKKFQNALPHELSGGMKTRVAIARALSFSPQILLLDEPFGALDEITRGELIFELLRIWETTKNTVFLVTHDIREAVLLADVVIVLTPRPAKIKEIVEVDLPKPRTREIRRSSQFVKLVEDLREKINNDISQ